MNLEELNQGDSEQACIELLKCCGSIKWVNNILAARIFSSVAHLHVHAEKIWFELGKDDYTELRQLGGGIHTKGNPCIQDSITRCARRSFYLRST